MKASGLDYEMHSAGTTVGVFPSTFIERSRRTRGYVGAEVCKVMVHE